MSTTMQALLAEIQAVLPAVQELHVLGSDAVPPVLVLGYVGSEAIGGYGVTWDEAAADFRRTVGMQTIDAMIEQEFLRCDQVATFQYANEYHLTLEYQGVPMEGVGASPQLAREDLRAKFYAHVQGQA